MGTELVDSRMGDSKESDQSEETNYRFHFNCEMKGRRRVKAFRQPGRTAALLILACFTCAIYAVVATCTEMKHPYFIVYLSAMIAVMLFSRSSKKESKIIQQWTDREKTHLKMSTRKYVLFTLIINGLAPWGIYEWLSHSMSSIYALTIATMVPLADNLVHLIKHKKLDVFGVLMLFTFILTLVLVSLGGSEKVLLIRESLITGSVGLVFLGSLLFKRPLMYYLVLRFLAIEGFSNNWKYKYFRFVLRLMTFVWGFVLVMESVVRVIMVNQLSTSQFLALSNFVLYGFIGAAILWTMIYRKKSARRLEQIKQQAI
ncbi:VC0807 family protein [Paenibacillus alginolyticus]|uniref:VC0807 family protein n=1 Tax=Paenibacillus alginolyticus TaxID=59839 RepID=UPI001FEB655E|nr:VC0807 family protein [Paenibacillus frigoriresistens]